MPRHADRGKVLVLRGPFLEEHAIISLLRERFEVQVVDDLPQALDALREGGFAAILTETGDFLPLQIGMVTDELGSAAVASLCAKLAGPLNDIVTETTEAMEDYIGHDDLRKRLQSVIALACDARELIHPRTVPGTAERHVPEKPTQPDPILSGKSVLVADDEEMMRLTIRDVLASCGSKVDLAANGEEALELLQSGTYDLVISDIKMPGYNGYEVFAAAKKASSATEVILITAFGYDPHHSIIRATGEGLAAVLMKPFKANRLLAECRAALSPRTK